MNKVLVVKTRDKEEMELLSNLISKMGIASRVVEREAMEDIGLAELMKDVDRRKKVSRETILKKLYS
ncbi:MAG TPA: hypothetical protein VMU30_00635 [Bacteroidota bacterium]|nr:hypothetical protein [Bacteroidota bacterium]